MEQPPKVECLRIFDGTLKLVYNGEHFADLPNQRVVKYEDIENAFSKFISRFILQTDSEDGDIEDIKRGLSDLERQADQLDESIAELEEEFQKISESSW